MKASSAYLLGALAFIVCVGIGVYYLVPGINHVLVSDHPLDAHIKHALVFFALALVSLAGSRFVANARRRA